MRIAKKLIPAFALLLISAMIMSSASFAWFTIGRIVSATGFEVTATAEGGILISRPDYEFAHTLVTPPHARATLVPTSTADAVAWYHASGIDEATGTAVDDTRTKLNLTPQAPTGENAGLLKESLTEYVLYDIYHVLPGDNAVSFGNLWISECSAKAEGATPKALSSSLRIAFRYVTETENNIIICAPVTGAQLNYKVNNTTDVTALDTSSSATAPLPRVPGSTVICKENTTMAIIEVYVYFEGEDSAVTTNNALDGIEELAITIKFTAATVTAKH